MIAYLKVEDRLAVLRAGDPVRSWKSLDDQRVCVVCGRKFKGRQVDIRRLPGGTSTLHQWVDPSARAARVLETNWLVRKEKRERHTPNSTLRMQACRI